MGADGSKRLLPIPPTASQLSSGVAVLSYGDELVFGITADYDAAPELQQLAAGIEREMARLTALSQDSVLLFTKDRRKRPSRALPTASPAPSVGASTPLTQHPGGADHREKVGRAHLGAGHHRPAPP